MAREEVLSKGIDGLRSCNCVRCNFAVSFHVDISVAAAFLQVLLFISCPAGGHLYPAYDMALYASLMPHKTTGCT